jgi:hypothetical protein
MAVKSAFAGPVGSRRLPVAQRSDADIQQSGELRLAQPDLGAERFDGNCVDVELARGSAPLRRTISFICVMLSMSSLNSFLFMGALLHFTSLR